MLVHFLVAALAQSTLAFNEMVLTDINLATSVGKEGLPLNLEFLIPNHEKRSIWSVMSGKKGVSHSYLIQDKTYSFNCKAGEKPCFCTMQIAFTNVVKSPIQTQKCLHEYDRDRHGQCRVTLFPTLGAGVDDAGACYVVAPSSYFAKPATLKSVSWRTFLVPRQPVAYMVTIRRAPMAIICDVEDSCACSMGSLGVPSEYTPCLGSTRHLRDAEGNCRVSIDRDSTHVSSLGLSCKVLDEMEVESRNLPLFESARHAVKTLESLPMTDNQQKRSISSLKEQMTQLDKLVAFAPLGQDKLDDIFTLLTRSFTDRTIERIQELKNVLDALDVKNKKVLLDKAASWERDLQILEAKSSSMFELDLDLKTRGDMLLEISKAIYHVLVEGADQMDNLAKTPKPVYGATFWQGIINLKSLFDALKSEA